MAVHLHPLVPVTTNGPTSWLSTSEYAADLEKWPELIRQFVAGLEGSS
jgi:hypothetical protein